MPPDPQALMDLEIKVSLDQSLKSLIKLISKIWVNLSFWIFRMPEIISMISKSDFLDFRDSWDHQYDFKKYLWFFHFLNNNNFGEHLSMSQFEAPKHTFFAKNNENFWKINLQTIWGSGLLRLWFRDPLVLGDLMAKSVRGGQISFH